MRPPSFRLMAAPCLPLALFLCLAFQVTAAPALAEPSQIVEIRAKTLFLYGTADGPRVDSLPRETVKLPIPILEIAPTNRLKAEIGGKQYWLAPHQVETDAVIKVETRCRDQRDIHASTRGNLDKCRP